MGGTDHVTLVTHDDLVTSQVGSLGPVDNTTIEYRAVRLGQARGSGWTALTKMHHTTQEVSPAVIRENWDHLSYCVNHAETELSDGVPAHPDKPQPQHGVRGD